MLCATPNPASADRCLTCGAARWDGPDGQGGARIRAALQTADAGRVTLRQVAMRVLLEASSTPGLGWLPLGGMQAQVAGVLLAAEQQASGAGVGVERAAAAGGDARSEQSAAAGADEQRLLELHGCPEEAQGAFMQLLPWLQRQQPQQPADGSSPPERLQAAAASAAALAPSLLAGVVRQQAGLPHIKLVSGLARRARSPARWAADSPAAARRCACRRRRAGCWRG